MANTKVKALDREVALEIVQDFFEKFEYAFNESGAAKSSDLEKYLAKGFQLSCNGQVRSKSLSDYITTIESLKKRYSHIQITNLDVDVLSSGYQLTARYTVNLNERSGDKRQLEILAIATFEDGHIIRWDEISNRHGVDAFA